MTFGPTSAQGALDGPLASIRPPVESERFNRHGSIGGDSTHRRWLACGIGLDGIAPEASAIETPRRLRARRVASAFGHRLRGGGDCCSFPGYQCVFGAVVAGNPAFQPGVFRDRSFTCRPNRRDVQNSRERVRRFDYVDVKLRYIAEDPNLCWHGQPYSCCSAGCGEDDESFSSQRGHCTPVARAHAACPTALGLFRSSGQRLISKVVRCA